MDSFLTTVGSGLAQFLKSLLALLSLAFQQTAARLGLTAGQRTKLPDSAAKKARRKKKKAGGEGPGAAAGAAPAQQPAAAAAGPAAAVAWSESESEEEEEPDTTGAGVPRGAWVGASYADSLSAGGAAWESAARPRKKAAGSSQGGAGSATSSRPAVPLPGQRHHKGPLHECGRPGCGAAGKKGFRKCRCGKIWYCTPACSASDWPRHQLECE